MEYRDGAMKTRKNSLISIATLFVLGTVALSAQSCAAVNHASNAVGHSVQASGEVVAASVESGAASVQLASGVVAVPVMASGAVVKGTGALLSGIGGCRGDGDDEGWPKDLGFRHERSGATAVAGARKSGSGWTAPESGDGLLDASGRSIARGGVEGCTLTRSGRDLP